MTDGELSNELRKLQAEYWSKRLEHTLSHTKTSSQLIYAVDGAVLALMYFALDKFRAEAFRYIWIALLALAIVNFLHARLIRTQHWWYTTIDKRYCECVKAREIERKNASMRSSTHGIYQLIHYTIAAALLVGAILVLVRGSG